MSFGKFSDDSHSQPSAEINMVPMIDVMLVLLIVFMVTAPLLTQAVKVDLPQETAAAEQPEPASLTISLDAKGQVWWEGEAVAPDELLRRLDEAAQKADPPELRIRADRATAYGRVADLMADASSRGLRKLAFVSDPLSLSSGDH
jgi:biopolymer transport protein ExbD